MTHRLLPLAIASVLVGALIAAPNATAQGNGRPKAPKTKPDNTPSSGTPTSSPSPTTTTSSSASTNTTTNAPVSALPTPVTTFRQFGSWLDDASAPARGEGSTNIGIGHWRMAGTSQTNFPMLGAGLGVTDRLQVSASVPFYHVNYDGTSYSGMDDVYLGAKYTLIDPTLTVSEFGLAISPVMEMLSAGASDGRVHFAIPVSMEIRRAPFRVYGSAGYFTRGSVFTGTALEWATPVRFVVTGALTQSYSVKQDATLDSMAVGRQRVDLTTSAAYPLGSMAAAYMSVGRSLSSLEEGGTSLALSGGLSFRFSTVSARP